MKMHGRVYVQIDPKLAEPGDYVILPGRRVRRIASRRDHEDGGVSFGLEPFLVGKSVLARARRVGWGEVESAWRWHKDAKEGDNDDSKI
jgi:hypothetical protein